MHHHNPCKYNNPLRRFVWYLVHPIKVFRYNMDGADICHTCLAQIALPIAYYSPCIYCIYFVWGILTGIITSLIPLFRGVVTFYLVYGFHHIISSFVFAIFEWDAYDPKRFNMRFAEAKAKKDFRTRILITGIPSIVVSILCRLLL